MAGFLFNMGADRSSGTSRESALRECLTSGVYATRGLDPMKTGRWSTPDLSILGDFAAMRPCDHVYFLCGRNVYGIGELVSIGKGCAALNYPDGLGSRTPGYREVKNDLLRDLGADKSLGARWICTFKPSPAYFATGVDMDVALSAKPSVMRRLPSNEGRTFIQLDDEEDSALAETILRANRRFFRGEVVATVASEHEKTHSRMEDVLARVGSNRFRLTVRSVLPAHRSGLGVKPEMVLEVALLEKLAESDPATERLFGHWDYVAHQVPASPTKPFRWMDKIDLFGYEYASATALPPHMKRPIISFSLIEVKEGKAKVGAVSQTMSYVDWVTRHYAGGDPSLVRAFLVARSFSEEVKQEAREFAVRHYTEGRREETTTKPWRRLTLVTYEYDKPNDDLLFAEAPYASPPTRP